MQIVIDEQEHYPFYSIDDVELAIGGREVTVTPEILVRWNRGFLAFDALQAELKALYEKAEK